MSNAGFANLATLKAHLLASAQRTSTAYDAPIAAIGLGAAAAIAQFCNRRFERLAADTEIIAADRVEFLLRRYPVEAVSKIELKLTEALGWEELVINDVVNTIDLESGIVHFAGRNDVGPDYGQVRFTYTGGYWWEQVEPDAGGYPTAQPAGSSALPADLKLAWLLQCEAVWMARDKLGVSVLTSGNSGDFVTGTISNLDLIPMVKKMLQQYIRFNLV